MSRDVPDLEKLYARKLWADFSYPKFRRISAFELAKQVIWLEVSGLEKSIQGLKFGHSIHRQCMPHLNFAG